MNNTFRKWCKPALFTLTIFLLIGICYLPDGIVQEPLWMTAAPLSSGSAADDIPTLELFLPAKSNGTAVIVCPGGGYGTLMLDYEGKRPAQWLNSLGITVFVLKYRVAPKYHYPAPFLDLERAIRWVRFHADEYHLHKNRIGLLGFSAGGHMAALAAEQWEPLIKPQDAVDEINARPDFILLGYPVVSMQQPLTHERSASNLLGPDISQALRDRLSAERHVMPGMPPVFLFLTADDNQVSPQNSLLLYKALQEAHVPSELHLYPHGPHGFALADGKGGTPDMPELALWKNEAVRWMKELGMLDASPANP